MTLFRSDLILLALLMPGMKRFEGLRAMRECLPQVPVVVMSAIVDRDEILRCIEAGAMGYIPKSAQSDEIESRSAEHTSELQSLIRISYSVYYLKKKTSKRPYVKEN